MANEPFPAIRAERVKPLTMAELENLRDLGLPLRLAALKRDEVLLGNWSARAEENARRARESFFSIQNSRKALDGRLAGLLDPQLMGQKQKAETDFKAQLSSKTEYADALVAYDQIASATKIFLAQLTRYSLLERWLRHEFSLRRARCSAPEMSAPNRTAIVCANFPRRTAPRSNWACFPRSRFIPIWKS